jgi:hypothetical protein
VHIPIPLRAFPNRAPIDDANGCEMRIRKSRSQQKGLGMTEQELRRAQEREEIAARIAKFKATQERFEREREEFFVSTWQRVRGLEPLPFWS